MLLAVMPAAAQSSMTDSQVAEMVQREMKAGTSQAQIVTKLMQSGVDIQQIRRVRDKYEKAQKAGLGQDGGQGTRQNRMRQNNGQPTTRDKAQTQADNDERRTNTTERLQGPVIYQEKYDPDDEDYLQMRREVGLMTEPMTAEDSIAWLDQILMEQKMKKQKAKVFGRDIFNNKELTFNPEMNIATPQNYTLGPGDAVSIDIYGASQKSLDCTVSPDGDIVVEGYGPIHVGGLSVSQAKAKIKSTLGSRYQSSRISLSLGQTRTISINVMGEVNNPGTYTMSAFATVFNALYMAGGTNDIGTLRNIKIYRRGRLLSQCDIYDYILNGKMTGNVRLNDGDVIIVGPYDCLVNITGKVKRPMYYEMKRNESVETLLKYAGGFTGDAYTKSVRLNRKTGREKAVFNVEEFDMASFRLADGDSVSVDSILPRYENTVEVKGAVFRPGMYQLGDGINSVRTLIEHAEGLTEEAFTARAVMHRMKPDRTLRVISVDVKGIMDGTTADIPLQENDVLFIPSKQLSNDDRTLTIHGEVRYPGIYRYAEGETLEDFVLQAGGLTEAASTAKVDVSRRTKDPSALVADTALAQTFTFQLKEGFVIDGQPGFTLQPYDQVFVRRSPAFNEQKNIYVEGEVMFPGTYTMAHHNMRLTELLAMAGGPSQLAYIKGARLERVPTEAERKRMEAALKMQRDQINQDLLTLAASTQGTNIQQVSQQATQTQMEKFVVPATYPVGIELDKALADPSSDANLTLREGDRLILPQYTSTVKINGAVMYPNTVTYERGKSVRHYINVAGGFSSNARRKSAYIIYMNGMVAKVSSGAKVQPGCEIVVPSKINRKMSTAEIMSLGTGVASIAAIVASIANLAK